MTTASLLSNTNEEFAYKMQCKRGNEEQTQSYDEFQCNINLNRKKLRRYKQQKRYQNQNHNDNFNYNRNQDHQRSERGERDERADSEQHVAIEKNDLMPLIVKT